MSDHSHSEKLKFSEISRKMQLAIWANLLYVAIEAGFGIWENSLALLADAGHNFADASSLFLSLLGFRLIKVKLTRHNTFGLRKLSILISLFNSLLIFGTVGFIAKESLERLSSPAPMEGFLVSGVAAVGVVINFFTAFLFFQDKEKELNLAGAYFHMLADGLVSVGVIISGLLIHYTGVFWIDPVVSILIALVIVYSIWDVLKQSFLMSIDAVPPQIPIQEVRKLLLSHKGVKGIHDLHVWHISTMEIALMVHLTLDKALSISQMEEIRKSVKVEILRFGINHSTLEFDFD